MSIDFPARYPEYLVAAMVIILAPGPSVLFIIARAIAWGRKTAIATVFGNVTGAFALSLMVAFGLGPILQRSELVFITVQIFGGCYLIYLGFDAIKHSILHAAAMTSSGDVKPSPAKSIKDGFWVGALNPKGLVFFAAILPQFIERDSSNVTTQLILLGATFSILAFFSDGAWGLIAGTVRQWMATSPERLVLLRRLGGVVMTLLGVFTLISAL